MDAVAHSGFLAAARVSVAELERLLGLDLWLVTCVDAVPRPDDVQRLLTAVRPSPDTDDPGEDQVVLAAAGPLADRVAAGARLPWSQSLCRRMVAGEGPWFAPDLARVPAYAALQPTISALGLGELHSYLGSPLRRPDGSVVGTVCAYGRQVVDTPDPAAFEHVHLVASLLSAVLASEARVAERDRDVERANELAVHDALTGLLNRRGWDRALGREQERVGRYGSAASILLVGLDGLAATNDRHGHPQGDLLLRRAAEVLARECRPSDVVARLGGDTFAVLAVEADILAARALAARLARALRSAAVPAGIGVAARRVGEDLHGATARADAAMTGERRRRRSHRAG